MNGGLRGKKREGQRLRITDLNMASHFSVVTSELVWVLMGRRWIEVQGKSGFWGSQGDLTEKGETCAG